MRLFALLPPLVVLLLAGCQSTPPPPPPPALEPDPLEVSSDEDFDLTEVVEVAESDEGTYQYLMPKIYQSPLNIKNNLWDRVRNNFQLDYEYKTSRIDIQLDWYIKNPAYLDRVNSRASRYLWHIVEEVQKRDMPMEIALLPIVESAFDPFAYSHARASGTWQFIPSTASFMGMKRDWWYDGRRDILVSTQGALDLLQLLHDRLNNDWLLALAAYNSGEGNVRKAISRNKRRGKPTDFWHLDLPRETRAYVPKLLALARLYKDPEKYNTYILPIPNEPYFDIVETGSQIDLAQAASLAKVELDEIYLLNPGLNRWATPPDGPHYLLVPRENADVFRTALAKLPTEERLRWQQYTVANGDTLSTIATRFKISPHTIASINRLKSSTVREGTSLMIPVASGANYALSQDQRDERVRKMLDDIDAPKLVHTVKSGETLSTIAKKYRVSTRNLAKWNGMAERDVLRVGRKLTVWKKGETVTSRPAIVTAPIAQAPIAQAPPAPEHTPASADVISTPAETPPTQTIVDATLAQEVPAAPADAPLLPALATGLPALEAAPAPLAEPPATEVAAPLPELPPASEERQIVYRVKAGDSLGKIANRFNTSVSKIAAWNNLDSQKILRPGQTLIVYTNLANVD